MSINIPLKLKQNSPVLSASANSGARLNLPINVSGVNSVSSLFSSDRKTQTLRAVAAAVSLQKADDALKKAKEAKDHPENVVIPEISDEKLSELISAVNDTQDNSANAQKATAEQVAAARAIGANPALVRAAFDKMQEDDAYLKNGMAWVAAFDGDLLESAAREGARRIMLDKVPVKENLQGLENRIDSLEDKIKGLEQLCRGEKTKPKQNPGKG
ncbi:MAG: hypothetical protein OQK98_06650 [Gammaproteobacteria bacterium]|nr:hypothetical protein [Gammaproteobacteria bacterium]